MKSVSKQVGDRQLRFKNRKDLSNRSNDDSLVLADGSNGEWTPHDLRRTAATMMQALGVSPDVIDRCQNHVLAGGRVRRHYLKHEYNDAKRGAWRLLGAEVERVLGQPGQALTVPPVNSAGRPSKAITIGSSALIERQTVLSASADEPRVDSAPSIAPACA